MSFTRKKKKVHRMKDRWFAKIENGKWKMENFLISPVQELGRVTKNNSKFFFEEPISHDW